jgi:ATP-dependent Lhr-like helicase
MVIHINYEERSVHVASAPRGKKPSWGGFVPQLLSQKICHKIAITLLRDDTWVGQDG